MAISPSTTIIMAMTIAKIGRLTKIFSHIFQCFYKVESAVRSGFDDSPFAQFMESGGDDPFAGVHSGSDDPSVAVRPSPSVTIRCRARLSLSSTYDAIYVLRLDDGRLWNQERSVNRVGHDLDPGELSRPEQRVGSGKRLGPCASSRSGLLLDGPADQVETAFLPIDDIACDCVAKYPTSGFCPG